MGVTGDDYSGPRSPACTLSRKTGDRISLRSYAYFNCKKRKLMCRKKKRVIVSWVMASLLFL